MIKKIKIGFTIFLSQNDKGKKHWKNTKLW
jgi:hypothetical protein